MRRDLRLLTLAGAAWGTALACVYVPDLAWWCAIGAGVGTVAVVAVVMTGRGRPGQPSTRGPGTGGGLLIVMLAVSAAVALAVAFAAPSREDAASWEGRVVEATGTIASSAVPGTDGRLWMDVQLSGLGAPGHIAPADAPVRVGAAAGDGFELGADVRVMGEAAATDPGERAALVVYASDAQIERPAAGAFAVAAGLKTSFVARSARLPEPGAGLLPGLAVGDTRAVSAQLADDMRASGLSHLTAVSGANCAIVVGAAFWGTALCGGGRRLRVAVGVLSLAGFVVIVTPEPSVIRASVMSGVAMLTLLLGRPRAGPGMLALCATGILIADPWLAAAPGFALSVVASGALVLLARPLADGLERGMPRPVAVAIGVPLAAQLACAPIIALFAEQQSLIGVAANLIAEPAAPVATVIGLLGCLAEPVPVVADLLVAAAWLPSAWIAATAEVSAALPSAQVSLVPGIASAGVVAVLCAAVAIVLLRLPDPSVRLCVPFVARRAPSVARRTHGGGVPRGERRWRPVRLLRMLSFGAIVVVLALGGARLLLTGPFATSTAPDGWSIAACDVGQGDALIVRSAGRVALIDTGPEPGPLEDCLRSLGIGTIDLLVLTHFDLDHVGGVAAVRGRTRLVLHGPSGGQADRRILADLAGGGAEVDEGAAGMRGTLGDASWRVRWPLRGSVAFPSGNDASVVVEFDGGGVPRSLFLGDLSAQSQRALARSLGAGGYAVVKVAHHGSADQDAGLYDALRPRAALISVGEGNDYGHPRRETLALLDATGARVLRTDRQGRLLLGLRDGELLLWTERSGG